MNCKFVIAEKPSVAFAIADALSVKEKKDNYLEGNGWIISWCYGHLTTLANPEVYNPDFAKWRREDLPVIPANWQFIVNDKQRKQFEILRKLMERDDVKTIINACDAGREGELIFRTVYEAAGCKKPIQRLWISSMEDTAIREGFENLRPGEQYESLY